MHKLLNMLPSFQLSFVPKALSKTRLDFFIWSENLSLIEQIGVTARKKVLERHNQEKAFQTFVEILNK